MTFMKNTLNKNQAVIYFLIYVFNLVISYILINGMNSHNSILNMDETLHKKERRGTLKKFSQNFTKKFFTLKTK